MGCFNVTTNTNGVPYISTTNVTVGDEAIDFALGFHRIQPVGLFTVRIANAIPADATDTLPITLTMNGTTRALTLFNGTPVTAADVDGTGVLLVFNDRFNNILQVMNIAA